MSFHQNLQDITEDQLSLASIHYMRSHYQEAIDIYKRILLDNRLDIFFFPILSFSLLFGHFIDGEGLNFSVSLSNS